MYIVSLSVMPVSTIRCRVVCASLTTECVRSRSFLTWKRRGLLILAGL